MFFGGAGGGGGWGGGGGEDGEGGGGGGRMGGGVGGGGGRRTPGPSLQPAQQPPAQECGCSTFLLGNGDRCQRARGGQGSSTHPHSKLTFFLKYILFFGIHIYIYNTTHIHWVQVHPGDSPTPHYPSRCWVGMLHFPLRGKWCQGAGTDPGWSL